MVVILGILAAIIIPQFASAQSAARATAMRSQLGTVRSQIAAWQVQNGGQIPGGPGGTAEEAIDTLIADGYLTRTVFVSPGFVWIWDSSRAELEIEYDPSIDPSDSRCGRRWRWRCGRHCRDPDLVRRSRRREILIRKGGTMLAHDLRYRTRFRALGAGDRRSRSLMLLLLGLGRITMRCPRLSTVGGIPASITHFSSCRQMAPPGSRVLAWRSDPVTRDVDRRPAA